MCFFLSVCVYISWQYLGSISLQYPTASFRAVWRDKIPPDTPTIGIGLAVETMANIATLQPADAQEEERTLDSAKGIAKNLYEFMASYSQNTGSRDDDDETSGRDGNASFEFDSCRILQR